MSRWRPFRGAVCAVVLASFVIGTTGVLPAPALLVKLGGGLVGEAYPCQGGRCACASARECWTTCQCQSMAEKVAWARDRGLAIPRFAKAARSRIAPSSLPEGRARAGSAGCGSCHALASVSEGEREPAEPASRDRGSSMPTLSPLGCRGIDTLLAFAVVTLASDARGTLLIRPRVVGRVVATPMEGASFRAMEVPTPPPRSRPA